MTARVNRPYLKSGPKRNAEARISNAEAAARYELVLATRDWNGCLLSHRRIHQQYPMVPFRWLGPEGPSRPMHVHRLIMLWKEGPLPKGMETRHLCGNPRCINPEHLAYGTRSENSRDRLKDGTMPRLTEAQVRDIRARATSRQRVDGKYVGRSNTKELAAEYKVSVVTIRNIVTRRTHYWLE